MWSLVIAWKSTVSPLALTCSTIKSLSLSTWSMLSGFFWTNSEVKKACNEQQPTVLLHCKVEPRQWEYQRAMNRPRSSSLLQSEACAQPFVWMPVLFAFEWKCECERPAAAGLALKMRVNTTRKWPITAVLRWRVTYRYKMEEVNRKITLGRKISEIKRRNSPLTSGYQI